MKSFVAPLTVAETAAGLTSRTLPMESDDLSVSGNVYDIQRFSIHDGPGIRTIVFFKGCPLRCLWCSNPESQRTERELLYTASRCLHCGSCVAACAAGALVLGENGIAVNRYACTACDQCSAVCPTGALRITGQRMNVEQVLDAVARDNIFYEHSGGGMTLSGGEPLAQPDFALALVRGARERGIHSAVETTGWASADIIRRVLGATDLILYDIKQMDPAKHQWGTGVTNDRILDNARVAAGLGIRMIIRVPVIPGFNDTRDDLFSIGRFAQELGLAELQLLPYHRYGVTKYASLGRDYALPDAAPPASEQIESLQRSVQALGLHVRVGG